MGVQEAPTGTRTPLEVVHEKHRETLRATARREAATRELSAARDALQGARTELRTAIREARAAGETFPQIASVLGVTPQRAQALAAKPPEASRR